MKKTKALLTVLIFSSTLLQINAQPLPNQKQYKELANKLVRSALEEQKAYDWLKELCKIGPRLSGSENSAKATYWAENKMKELGFDSVWLQPVMVPHWVRGEVESAVISHSKKYKGRKLEIAAFGGSVGTPKNGVTGEVYEVKSFDELEQHKDEAKRKIIFFNRPFDSGLTNTFRAYGNAVDQRVRGSIEAAKVGGIASIVRSITSKHDNVPHTGVMYYVDSLKKVPDVGLGWLDSDFLEKAIKEDPHLQITIKLECKTLPDVQSYNVIGEIKGTEKPKDIIIVGGHFDSWDKGCGAQDDGAPSLQTMEALDLLNRFNIKPKRTIRCILFINEENGDRGGEKYAEYADTADENQVAAIESDRGAFTPKGFYVTSDSTIINKMQQWLPVLNVALIDWIRPGGSGTDVAGIKNAKALIGYAPDDQRYFDFHHSDNDVLEAVNPREMELGSAAIALMAYLISEEGL